MKKAERINDMMIYLNGKNAFQLNDIIKKYHISKSTALRDIQSLEEIGMPLYSLQGRNGHYKILPNRLLSPIVFTVDEMYALYFAMQTLHDYQSTPFHLSVESLKQKFEMCLSEEKKSHIQKMEQVLKMGVTKHYNESIFLKEILEAAILGSVCEIEYQKESGTKKHVVQFLNITSSFGQWYTAAFSFVLQKPILFRCDRIVSFAPSKQYEPIDQNLYETNEPDLFRSPNAIEFQVEIKPQAIDRFRKESYPSMKLEQIDDRFYISGYFNPGEEYFIANYLMSYGQQILSIQPPSIKQTLLSILKELNTYYMEQIG